MAAPGFHNAIKAAQSTMRQVHEAPKADANAVRIARAALREDNSVKLAAAIARRVPSEWSWRSTGDPGSFELWRHGESVGMLTVLPGHIERRAVLLDMIVDHLNTT